ncbi:DUF1851 domain-containing protein [Kribbella pratensis]|uniref:T6SS immunity protein Tdi1 C-terminal domain-containing protein n=1 Tax=Kribbella pratensis TaxID=2512112 RepID=A0A4R8C3M9_9ACTN|nr:DUF1851 domain-containing protein [Kribbella pratensis]TDW69691.1 hypothetical protein EV653_3719 [Kribbella pratensis]
MLERFCATFRMTDGSVNSGEKASGGTPPQMVRARLGGCSFEHGLYRVHTDASAEAAAQFTDAAFPEFRGRFDYLGFDWLGRQFAADNKRGAGADPEVMMLEPETGEALEIPVPVSAFHDDELVEYTDEALASSFNAEWMAGHESALRLDQCAGYRVPLFLGGDDVVANLEVSDLSVCWGPMGKLRLKAMHITTRGLDK